MCADRATAGRDAGPPVHGLVRGVMGVAYRCGFYIIQRRLEPRGPTLLRRSCAPPSETTFYGARWAPSSARRCSSRMALFTGGALVRETRACRRTNRPGSRACRRADPDAATRRPRSRPRRHPMKIARALLSLSDKTGLLPFARALVEEFGVELLSTGGTAKSSCATPNCPSPRSPTSRVSPRCSAAVSRRSTRRSTAACCTSATIPRTSSRRKPTASSPSTCSWSTCTRSAKRWRSPASRWRKPSSRSTSAGRRCCAARPRTAVP